MRNFILYEGSKRCRGESSPLKMKIKIISENGGATENILAGDYTGEHIKKEKVATPAAPSKQNKVSEP